MRKMEIFNKIMKLLEMIDELESYGIYTYEEKVELEQIIFKNFNERWGDKK